MAATRVVLSAYRIRIRKKQTRTYLTLDLFDDKQDFLELCTKCLADQLEVQQRNEEAQHLIVLDKLEKDDRAMYGLIRSGEYGQACDVVNAVNGRVVYNKKVTDADMLPFYFRVEVPTDSDKGLLIVQKGNSFTGGIKTTLEKKLKQCFETKNEDYRVDFDALLPK